MISAFGIDHGEIEKFVSAKERKRLAHQKHPQAQSDGSFPTPDKKHARLALAMLHNAPKSQQASIRARAERKLHGN